jgi:hypothetical protein
MDTQTTGEVDLHRLELRFAQARLLEPRAVEQLCRSRVPLSRARPPSRHGTGGARNFRAISRAH